MSRVTRSGSVSGSKDSATLRSSAATAGRGPANPGARATEKLRESRRFKEQNMRLTLNCLGIVAGLLVIILSIGFCIFSAMVGNILGGIRDRDLSKPFNRLQRYEEFFDSLSAQGYAVRKSPVVMQASEQVHRWRVVPNGDEDGRLFTWKFMLETNKVEPQTNAALNLDVKLGYVKEGEAQGWDFSGSERYDPNDKLVIAIVESDASLAQGSNLNAGWEDSSGALTGPVGAPLISPDEAQQRQARLGGTPQPQEPVPGEEGAPPGDSVPVGEDSQAQEDDGSVVVGTENDEEEAEEEPQEEPEDDPGDGSEEPEEEPQEEPDVW